MDFEHTAVAPRLLLAGNNAHSYVQIQHDPSSELDTCNVPAEIRMTIKF